MNGLKFSMDYGMLQVKDINPQAPGPSTKDLTNPRVEDEENAQQEIMTGRAAMQMNPLLYVAAAAGILFLINQFQK